MGLDVYAVRPTDERVVVVADAGPGVRWQGPPDPSVFEALPRWDGATRQGLWWPSDGDPVGTRGAVYADLVENAFAVSLYELLSPTEVSALASRVRAVVDGPAAGLAALDAGPEAGDDEASALLRALSTFLDAAAAQGCWLYPDY